MQETPLISKELFCTQVIENQEAMFRTARAILRSDEDAEDAVQEAICAAFAHRGDLRSPENSNPGFCGSWPISATMPAAGGGPPWI